MTLEARFEDKDGRELGRVALEKDSPLWNAEVVIFQDTRVSPEPRVFRYEPTRRDNLFKEVDCAYVTADQLKLEGKR
jgi:hypothetical protein